MNKIRNLSDIKDFDPLAYHINHLLRRDDNADIALEFPSTVMRYGGDLDAATDNLRMAQQACRRGIRQQFVAFHGLAAVGMSIIGYPEEVPEQIDPRWPNVSGFVCNPFRGRGIGRLSLMQRLKVVEDQFGGSAWTKVKKTNLHSINMVTEAGFRLIGDTEDSNIYTYTSN